MTTARTLEEIRNERLSLGRQREELVRRMGELRSHRLSLGRPSMSFGLSTAQESKREIDAWKALNPELERRHAEFVNEEDELARRIESLERREHIESRLADRLLGAGVKAKYLEHALQPAPMPALEVARNWLAQPKMWALVLCGTTGTGKTVAGVWAMAETLREAGTVASRRAFEIGRMPLYRSARERDEFKHLSSAVDLLLIDELGASSLTENGRGLLLELLSNRYEASMRTVLTTNLVGAPLQGLLGERIFDRLRDGGRVVDVSGQSMRGQR